jgi:hypothetical protein
MDKVNLALFSADFVNETTIHEAVIKCEQKEYQIKWKDATHKEFYSRSK